MPKTRKASAVWKYFTKNPIGANANCNICLKDIKTNGNTTNLRQHIIRVHKMIDIDDTSGMIPVRTATIQDVESENNMEANAAFTPYKILFDQITKDETSSLIEEDHAQKDDDVDSTDSTNLYSRRFIPVEPGEDEPDLAVKQLELLQRRDGRERQMLALAQRREKRLDAQLALMRQRMALKKRKFALLLERNKREKERHMVWMQQQDIKPSSSKPSKHVDPLVDC